MENEDIEKEIENLSEKQRRFIDNFILYGDAKKSAIEAGYSEKTAKTQGSQNLSKLNRFIKYKMSLKDDEKIAKEDEVLKYLTAVMRGEIKDQFELDASLQDRTKCAELLGKRYGSWVEKKEVDANVKTEIRVTLEDD